MSSSPAEKEKDEVQKSNKSDKKGSSDDCKDTNSERSNVAITIDPEEAKFAHSGGKSEHMIVNFTTKRMAIKVRCGSQFFRVEPTHIIIEPNKCRQLNITRLPGPIQTDKVFVQYVECDEKATDAKVVFKNAEAAGTKIPNLKIKLIAAAAGGRKMSREVVEE